MKEEPFYDPALGNRPLARRISWAAIFAGLIITLVAELVLTVLGISIGASALNPLTADQGTAQGFGIGAAIWLLVVSIISLFLGGWVAGRLSGFARGAEGALHGLITWGAAMLLAVGAFSALTGGLLSGTAGLLKSAMPVAGQAISGAQGGMGEGLQGSMGGQGADNVRQEAQKMSQGGPELVKALGPLLKDSPNVKPEDRATVVNLLVSKNNMSQEEANETVDRWIQTAGQGKARVEEKARQVGSAAAEGVSTAGWASFIVLVLSGLAAAWGGSWGAAAFLHSRPEVTARAAA